MGVHACQNGDIGLRNEMQYATRRIAQLPEIKLSKRAWYSCKIANISFVDRFDFYSCGS